MTAATPPALLDPQFTVGLAELVPQLHLDALGYKKSIATRRQQFLASYVFKALGGRHRHKAVPGAIYLSAKRLRSDLGTKDTALIARLLEPLFTWDQHSSHAEKRHARAFTLRPEIQTKATKALRHCRPPEPVTIEAITTAEPPVKKATKVIAPRPCEPVQHARLPGMPSFIDSLPALLTEVTSEVVASAYDRIEESDIAGRVQLLQVQRAVEVFDGLPNDFGLQANGRLNPKHRDVHIAQQAAAFRDAFFAPLDYYQADMSSCHPRLVVSLGHVNALDYATEHLQHYVEHKHAMHAEWAEATGHDAPDDFKPLVLSLINGQTRSTHHKSSLAKRLGEKTAKRWTKLSSYRRLSAEIHHARESIMADSIKHGHRNAVGCVGIDLKKSNIVAHQLFGREQWCMNVMVSSLQPGVLRSVIADCWVQEGLLFPDQVRHLTETVRGHSHLEWGFPLDVELTVKRYGEEETEEE